jgi:hypothetical protein
VAVGGEHACATTATARRPTLANSGTPSVPNNVVCWGNSWWQGALQPGAVTSPHWTQAFTVPEFIDPGAALGAASGQLSAGGTLTSVANAAVGVEATQIFSWGTHWNTNAIDGAGLPSYATATGGAHFCGLERGVNQGLMSCWGDNTSGQLGTGTTDGGPPYQHHVVPLDGVAADNVDGLQVGRFLIARQVVAAGDTTCALLGAEINANLGPGQVDGTVACWGRNAAGVAGGPLGDGAYLAPHLVLLAGGGAPLTGAAAVSVGGRHGVALLVDGRLAFWGANDHGQFGGPSDGAALVTIVSPPHGPVAAVSAGQDFTCYIGADAKVYCSGVNDKGQLGDGTTTERLTPVQVLGVTGATVLSSGGVPRTGNPVHGGACALAGGHVSCWGDNSAGQVGAGTGSGFYTTARLVQMTPLPVLPAAPATPAALAVTAAGAGSVTLTWTAVPGATSYNVYYSTSSPVTTLDTKVTNAAIGGDVTGLAGGTPYFLVVTAENLGGESAVSNEVTATPDLAVPNNVFAAPGDGQVSLSWAPVPGATSYTVYWSTAPDVSKAAVDHLAATTESAPVTGLVDGTAYYFVVTASNALAPESADSAVAGPITPAAPGP